ncbi:MAG: DUF333 domain-containing protein [Methanoregula sp.]|nr:DUF333 domain-containing protein [Methanoregula sp.]
MQGVQAAPDSLANPASVNCGKVGATSEILKNPDGSEYGMCKFPNSTSCEEWALFRGEGCKPNVAPVTTIPSTPTILQTTIKIATPTSTTDNDAKIAALEKQIAEQNKKIDQQGNILDQITNLLRNIFGWNIVTPTPVPVTSPTPTSTPVPTTIPSRTPTPTQTPTPQIIYITVTPTPTPTPQIVYVTVPVTQTSLPTSTPVSSGTIVIPVTTPTPAVPATGVYVRISYIGVWKGTYGMPAALQTVDKSGDRFYEIANAIGPVQVTAEKLDGSTRHELVVEIYKNGQLLTSGKTSEAFGKVTVSADATTGVAQTPTPTQTPTASSGTGSTGNPASAVNVVVDVGEKDYLGNIPVIYQGGPGQITVKKIDVTLYRSDGQVRTATIGINKGDLVVLEGTKQTDRVVVSVSMDNGQSYTINDVMSPYRTRQ